jgi:putative chitinase
MNLPNLFNAIKSISNQPLSQVQVDSVNAILASCVKHGVTLPAQIAYVLGTAYHESRLKPIEEIGKGQGHAYGVADPLTHQTYYGRGFVQLTWKANYQEFGRLLGIDLVNHPELALNIADAAEIIVVGMKGGLFTGVGLSRFITTTATDFVNARKIVNGLDRAALIAGYAQHILVGMD